MWLFADVHEDSENETVKEMHSAEALYAAV